MELAKALGVIVIVIITTLATLYIIGGAVPVEDYIEELTTTTTTTTLPLNTTIAWLENRIHELVNEERASRDLQNLTWNSEVASVARMHSLDMAENKYFSHTNLEGMNVSDRLRAAGVYYWNSTGENLLKGSLVKYFLIDFFGNIKETVFKDLENCSRETVGGWMNSTGHRENILNGKFNEVGVGVADGGNNTFYFTQVFITRTNCGYYQGECCPIQLPYLPWCYVPYRCTKGVCK